TRRPAARVSVAGRRRMGVGDTQCQSGAGRAIPGGPGARAPPGDGEERERRHERARPDEQRARAPTARVRDHLDGGPGDGRTGPGDPSGAGTWITTGTDPRPSAST